MDDLRQKIAQAMEQEFVGNFVFSDEEISQMFEFAGTVLRNYDTGYGNSISQGYDEWLFVSMVNASDTSGLYRNGIMSDRNITEGVVVVQAERGSGAYDAGLTTGDVITKIDGKKVEDSAYLRYELYQHQAGDTIQVTYIRDGEEHTVDVKLSASE